MVLKLGSTAKNQRVNVISGDRKKSQEATFLE